MELRRRETGESHRLEAGMVFGRLQDCQVRIQDGSISRRHAKIEEVDGVLELVDLDSSNGIFVNGTRAPRIPLRSGDLVTLGAVAFDVVGAAPAAAPAAVPADLPTEDPEPAGEPEPAVRSSSRLEETERARARLRREVTGDGRSRGLGDLGQQPFGIQVLVGLLGLAVLYGVVTGIRFLGGSL